MNIVVKEQISLLIELAFGTLYAEINFGLAGTCFGGRDLCAEILKNICIFDVNRV